MSEAKLALSGQGKVGRCRARRTLQFCTEVRQNSWHFYDAGKLLGDLALGVQ